MDVRSCHAVVLALTVLTTILGTPMLGRQQSTCQLATARQINPPQAIEQILLRNTDAWVRFDSNYPMHGKGMSG